MPWQVTQLTPFQTDDSDAGHQARQAAAPLLHEEPAIDHNLPQPQPPQPAPLISPANCALLARVLVLCYLPVEEMEREAASRAWLHGMLELVAADDAAATPPTAGAPIGMQGSHHGADHAPATSTPRGGNPPSRHTRSMHRVRRAPLQLHPCGVCAHRFPTPSKVWHVVWCGVVLDSARGSCGGTWRCTRGRASTCVVCAGRRTRSGRAWCCTSAAHTPISRCSRTRGRACKHQHVGGWGDGG